MEIGLIELLLVFVGVLGLAIWDLRATHRAMGAAPSPEPARPHKAGAEKVKTGSSPPAKKNRRAKPKTASA